MVKGKVKGKTRSTSTLSALARKRHHGIVTFARIIKYGISSFSRNAWLSVAATAIMIVTLTVISATLIARDVMVHTVATIKDKVDMSIYVKNDTDTATLTAIERAIANLPNVKKDKDGTAMVTYESPSDARKSYIEDHKDNPDAIAALGEATDRFPGTFHIKLIDINKTEELESLVENNKTVKEALDPDAAPSFSTERREAIDKIANTANFVERAGLSAGAVFIVIASLIIFNTIRMAIFNRREEIYMMKLIGADKSFIRGPFIVEAIHYGVIAAIITSVIIVVAVTALKDSPSIASSGIAIQSTYDMLFVHASLAGGIEIAGGIWWMLAIGLMLLGALIGVVSSLFATRKYL